MARYVAKNIVAAGLADRCEVQLAYAIGVSEPVTVIVDTYGTGKIAAPQIAELVGEHFPLPPGAIIKHLDLRRPIYRKTAAAATSAARTPSSPGSGPTRPTPSARPPAWPSPSRANRKEEAPP